MLLRQATLSILQSTHVVVLMGEPKMLRGAGFARQAALQLALVLVPEQELAQAQAALELAPVPVPVRVPVLVPERRP